MGDAAEYAVERAERAEYLDAVEPYEVVLGRCTVCGSEFADDLRGGKWCTNAACWQSEPDEPPESLASAVLDVAHRALVQEDERGEVDHRRALLRIEQLAAAAVEAGA